MSTEPYRPGDAEGIPPQSPTQFDPAKPAGPDPVSPMPLPEGSEVDRHAQLFAYDPSSGQFKPVEWVAGGKLKVDAVVSVPPGGMDVHVENWADEVFTVVATHIERDPATNLVSLIAETDGSRTKNSVFTRDADGLVTEVQEVLV